MSSQGSGPTLSLRISPSWSNSQAKALTSICEGMVVLIGARVSEIERWPSVQGGGDSDTVSVLSGHQSRPEGEVTGPQAPSQLSMDSEAAKIRKVRSEQLIFTGTREHMHIPGALY